MTLLATIPVNNAPGSTAIGPWTVPNTDNQLSLTFSVWAQSTSRVGLAVEVSLDGAVTWTGIGTMTSIGPVVAKGLPGFGTVLPLTCATCGRTYLPGETLSLNHSTVALKPGVTLSQIGQLVPFPVVSTASFLTRVLVDNNGFNIDAKYVDRVFHTPTPNTAIARQVRATLTVTVGTVTSTLTVTST